MKNQLNVHTESMDEMVFENRNKLYGAYVLRKSYNGNVLKAMFIAASIFAFSAYTPILAKNMGWINEITTSKEDTLILVFDNKKFEIMKKVEPKIKFEKTKPLTSDVKTKEFKEIIAVKPDLADKTKSIKNEELKTDEKIGTETNLTGKETIFYEETKIEQKGFKKNVYDVEELTFKPKFDGDFNAYINENIDYTKIPENNITEVSLIFIIDEKGNVLANSIEIIKSSGDKKMDKEAIRLTKEQPAYIPAKVNSEYVKVKCKVTIKLGEKEE